MKPQSLTLTNYRAFESAQIDLSAVTAAAIVGQNGSGKSSVVEAMLFALYGETRSTGVDGPVRLGTQEASVELTYSLNGDSYRVIRKRSRAKRSSLDYLVASHEDWKVLTGSSIAETQTKIERDLGMSKSLFLASSAVMQGQSSGICEAGPADRKRVLMEILADRLARFGPLAEAAKIEVKKIDEELAATRAERAMLEAVIAQKDTVTASRLTAETALAEVNESIKDLEARLAGYEQQAAEHKAKLDQVEALKRQVAQTQAELGQLQQQADSYRATIGEADMLLDTADDVRQQVETLGVVEQRLVEFDALNMLYQDLIQQYRTKEAELKAEGERLGAEEKRLQDRIESAKGRLLSAAQRHSLVNEVPCKDSAMAAECKLLANARKAGEEIAQIEAEIVGYEQQARDISDAIKAHTDKYTTDLDALKAQAAELHYDREAHELLQNKRAGLLPARDLLPRIESAQGKRDVAARALADVGARGDAAQESLSKAAAQLQELNATLGSMQWLALKSTADRELHEAKQTAGRLSREIGGADQKLADIARAEQRIKEIDSASAQSDRRRLIFSTLQQAFGRDGIPALIIDHAIPQIEEQANEILDRLSDGRMRVRLATQRETQTAGIAETLDIIISDDQGERLYEDWSGGERLRIDLAVRIALGRMLAARTGAKIELLVLDECCAPLDESGEDALIDCINRLREWFGTILMITHREALKDRLPQQIIVTRNGSGSQVELVA